MALAKKSQKPKANLVFEKCTPRISLENVSEFWREIFFGISHFCTFNDCEVSNSIIYFTNTFLTVATGVQVNNMY